MKPPGDLHPAGGRREPEGFYSKTRAPRWAGSTSDEKTDEILGKSTTPTDWAALSPSGGKTEVEQKSPKPEGVKLKDVTER